jgi:hypothetical protein
VSILSQYITDLVQMYANGFILMESFHRVLGIEIDVPKFLENLTFYVPPFVRYALAYIGVSSMAFLRFFTYAA